MICLYQFIALRKEKSSHVVENERKLTIHQIAQSLKDVNLENTLPSDFILKKDKIEKKVFPEYTLNSTLQDEMVKLFKQYNPDYGAFVAIDAPTGRILSLISYNPNDPQLKGHLALKATFPSASVFKVVTASAAIAEKKLHPDSLISFSGRSHTLYKSQLFKETSNRWTRKMTLKEAFAKSVNTVFGKIGVFNLGPTELKTYADRFGFNRMIESDLPLETGKAIITEDPFEVAETASGYTLENRMSPLQGALIAATIVNDGVMMTPYIVQRLRDETSNIEFIGLPKVSANVLDSATTDQMKELFRETVTSGTSKKSFRGFFKGIYSDIDAGGKTGSLTGDTPKGKYDWYVGYAQKGSSRIAFASLTISKEYWKVKSSYVVRRAMEVYFKNNDGAITLLNKGLAAGK